MDWKINSSPGTGKGNNISKKNYKISLYGDWMEITEKYKEESKMFIYILWTTIIIF